MSKTIRELWYGNLNLPNPSPSNNPTYKNVLKKQIECMNQIEPMLSEPLRVLWETQNDLESQLANICIEDAFEVGFRLGVRLTAEAFTDDKDMNNDNH